MKIKNYLHSLKATLHSLEWPSCGKLSTSKIYIKKKLKLTEKKAITLELKKNELAQITTM